MCLLRPSMDQRRPSAMLPLAETGEKAVEQASTALVRRGLIPGQQEARAGYLAVGGVEAKLPQHLVGAAGALRIGP